MRLVSCVGEGWQTDKLCAIFKRLQCCEEKGPWQMMPNTNCLSELKVVAMIPSSWMRLLILICLYTSHINMMVQLGRIFCSGNYGIYYAVSPQFTAITLAASHLVQIIVTISGVEDFFLWTQFIYLVKFFKWWTLPALWLGLRIWSVMMCKRCHWLYFQTLHSYSICRWWRCVRWLEKAECAVSSALCAPDSAVAFTAAIYTHKLYEN